MNINIQKWNLKQQYGQSKKKQEHTYTKFQSSAMTGTIKLEKFREN